ncbi:hypothetical protein [Caldibacillus debilis]|uniref:hypothetical protein n=1 Tax=Caldibacillus debilis TaxID=301148 RepID=UPI0016005D2D|nr:hypothetical protein [Caldibacillus debilis]
MKMTIFVLVDPRFSAAKKKTVKLFIQAWRPDKNFGEVDGFQCVEDFAVPASLFHGPAD